MLFIAILILIFLMYRFFTFRAEMVFTMSLIAPIMIVIGACYLPGKYHEAGIFLLVIGAFMLAVVLLICRLTALGVEKGLRLEYYKNLIIYGALKFLQNLSKATIVFSFLAASLGAFSMDYKGFFLSVQTDHDDRQFIILFPLAALLFVSPYAVFTIAYFSPVCTYLQDCY